MSLQTIITERYALTRSHGYTAMRGQSRGIHDIIERNVQGCRPLVLATNQTDDKDTIT